MKELQQKIKSFCKEYKLQSPPEHQVLDILSELGEVAKEVLKMSNYGRKEPKYKKQKIEPELGDLLYSLITLANSFGIDLERALDLTLEKYKNRLKNKDSVGSK